MIHLETVKGLLELDEQKLRPLFKEKQVEVLRKLVSHEVLTETQERYLRGNIKTKLNLLYLLNQNQYETKISDYSDFLKIIDSYYITGLEALKINGYGWDYTTKVIEVINTKLKGEVQFADKIVKFIKVKSIKSASNIIEDGLKYASNEQILKDLNITNNELVERRWLNLYKTYEKSFSKIKPKAKHKHY